MSRSNWKGLERHQAQALRAGVGFQSKTPNVGTLAEAKAMLDDIL